MIARLAWRAMMHRSLTTGLAVTSVALSVALLLGVERVRQGARDSFRHTISQTDLIVGARSGSVPLLLYTVFHMGNPTANVSYRSFQELSQHRDVKWTVPLSLGDSHRGFRVIGTEPTFFEHYRYRMDRKLSFVDGTYFQALDQVVLGADVASRLGYRLGDQITLSHGFDAQGVTFQEHEAQWFRVVGILEKNGTPLDRSLLVSLSAIEWLHVGWDDGAAPMYTDEGWADKAKLKVGKPESITAFLLGTHSRLDTLGLQRQINESLSEPLLAIVPGVALDELWGGLEYAETALRAVSVMVVMVGLIGMLIAIYNTLNERRREMAILRSIGAGARVVMSLFLLEALMVTGLGVMLGLGLLYLCLALGQTFLEQRFGLFLPVSWPAWSEWIYIAVIFGFGGLMGFVPAYRAYVMTLHDGLTVRL